MTKTIGYDEIVRMIRGAAAEIKRNHELLSKLDSAIGDGDHGMAMLHAAEAMEKAVDEDGGRELKSLLHGIGWAVMSIDGGSTGPLFGTFFMGLSEQPGDATALDPARLADVFQAGLAKLQKQSKAQVGVKTMIDALVPAVDALRSAADDGADVGAALSRAAEAADNGAKATADMQAKFGRARNLGERTLGHVDPGATSVACMFRGFRDGISD